MSRELHRVPLDFQWPLHQVWEGFLNPFYAEQEQCPHCELGYSDDASILRDLWYGHRHDRITPKRLAKASEAVQKFVRSKISPRTRMTLTEDGQIIRSSLREVGPWSKNVDEDDIAALLAENRLMDFTRRPITPEQAESLEESKKYWLDEDNGYIPTPAEVNEWASHGMGHDCINMGIVLNARCEKLGIDLLCPHCHGTAITPNPELQAKVDAWEPTNPPEGEGWQLWETVSEGSPVTPVFATAEELVEHMVTILGFRREGAEAFVKVGWAPSFVGGGGVVQSGVDALAGSSEDPSE